ncbi:MAG: glycosyltransferase family 92 protein [Desulfovibrio sp.]|nr:glycosyltransferase family 92 protein [Desulfovibrio sp.]
MLYAAVCAIARDETPHLREWALHHLATGFEHLIIYDNGSQEPVRQTLADLLASGLLTVLDFPGQRAPQLSAYYHCLRESGTGVCWLAFVDIDEFILPLAGRDIKDLLATYEDHAALAAHWMLFGSNGHLGRPASAVARAYTESLGLDGHIKSIVQPRHVLKPLSPHHFAYTEGHCCVNEDHVPVLGAQSYPVANKIRVNHYYFKSQQDFEEKIVRGLATPVQGLQGRSMDEFYAQSQRSVYRDRMAERYSALTSALGRLPAAELARLILRDARCDVQKEMSTISTMVQNGHASTALSRYRRLRRYHGGAGLLILGAGIYFLLGDSDKGQRLLGEALLTAGGDAAQQVWVYEQIRHHYTRQGREDTAQALSAFVQKYVTR